MFIEEGGFGLGGIVLSGSREACEYGSALVSVGLSLETYDGPGPEDGCRPGD